MEDLRWIGRLRRTAYRAIAPAAVMFFLCAAARAQAPVQCAGPLTEASVIKLAASGVPDARLVQIIEACGAGFTLSNESEERL